MYEPLWQLVKQTISGERALEYTRQIWEHARWNSFDRMQDTADAIASSSLRLPICPCTV